MEKRKKKQQTCRKAWLAVLFTLTVLVSATVVGYGASSAVNVTIPQFTVQLNGIKVDNTYRKYPFLVYKEITYFPMTYYDCRFLGVESQWNEKSRVLSVKQSAVGGAYQDYKTNLKNKNAYQAQISNAALNVNGAAIDNRKEPYPVLLFRDVTYFPMTWKYGVNSFGWNYQFDQTNGLVIRSKNASVTSLTLPVEKLADGEYNFVLAGERYFYQGQNGIIYMTSTTNPADAKKVYQLPVFSYGDGKQLVYASLSNEHGNAVLRYHQGGATMGSDMKLTFASDGTYKEETEDYLYRASFVDLVTQEKKEVSVYYGMFSDTENLKLSVKDGESILLGDSTTRYMGTPVIAGESVFVIGRPEIAEGETERSSLYKINMATNEVQQLTQNDLYVSEIKLEEKSKTLYAVTGKLQNGEFIERSLYSMNLEGVNQKKVAALVKDAPQFSILDGNVYYTSGSSQNQVLYRLGADKSLNPKGKLVSMGIAGESYFYATFKEEAQCEYRLMVFDKSGKLVFCTADVAQQVDVEKGRLFYVDQNGKACLVTLP